MNEFQKFRMLFHFSLKYLNKISTCPQDKPLHDNKVNGTIGKVSISILKYGLSARIIKRHYLYFLSLQNGGNYHRWCKNKSNQKTSILGSLHHQHGLLWTHLYLIAIKLYFLTCEIKRMVWIGVTDSNTHRNLTGNLS